MIPQGYKQTEVGINPEDWCVTTIGNIGLIVGGGTPSTAVDAHWNGNIQWFTPAEITDVAKYISKSFRTISDLGLRNCSAKLLPKGTILLTTRASIGHSAILLNEAATNQGFQSIVVNSEHNNEFIYYLLKTKVDEMRNLASGSTFLEISNKKLSSISIAIPPIEEQRRIAEVLSDVDGLITALDKKIAKKKLIKQAAMQQLLTGKKRLQGFSGEWTTNKLGDFVKLLNGYAFRSETYSEIAVYKIITIANVQNGKLDMSNYNSIDNLPSDIQRHQRLNIGDVLISMTGNVGRVCIVSENNCLLNQRVGLLEFLHCTNIDDKFLYKVLCSSKFESAMIDCGQGAAQANISKSNIENYTFILPIDTKEQQAIATILSDMDAEISDLERKRDKYKLLKNGMMQKLLTGQIRIKINKLL